MSDDFEPFATAGSGKSEVEVAFDLLNKLKGQGVWGEKNMPVILDMYAECLDAVKGLRAYEGQKRMEVPILRGSVQQAAKPTAAQPVIPVAAQPVAQQPQIQQPPAQQPPVPQQPVQQPVAAPQSNPVQTQQQHLQQQIQRQA